MERRRLAQLAAIVALGLGVTAFWMAGSRRDSGASVALGPLFRRVVIAPGDDPSALPLPVEDAHLIEVDRNGALLVHSGDRVRRQKPHAYQDINGRRQDVSVRFDITAAGDPRLVVGTYDRTRPLVIEPETGKHDLQH
jgi:hypothetical protein